MTDLTANGLGGTARRPNLSQARIRRRYRAERRFRAYGMLAVAFAVFMLGFLAFTVAINGYTAFLQTRIDLDIAFDAAHLDPKGDMSAASFAEGDPMGAIKEALIAAFPQAQDRADRKVLYNLVSNAAGDDVLGALKADPGLLGETARVSLLASDEIDMLAKGTIDRNLAETDRSISDKEIAWFDRLAEEGRVHFAFNFILFTRGDSREPEQAGLGGALMGSFLTIVVALLLALPISVAAAIYLEEFAAQNRLTDLIEININNLAAVPSIVFGLLGLAVLLGFFGLPRSAPLVGGMVLSLMTLPTIIIATRAALRAVPPSIREAALGVGASKQQVIFDHVLPLAMPGIMTGAIIGTARAMGESAAVLMIGMVAFIVDVPGSVTDPATVLPVQIYLWADSPERAFVERTSAGIIVMLVFLVAMNAAAVIVRRRFERRW